MNNKTKNKVVVGLMAAIVLVFTLLCLFLPKPEFLDSERREPAKFPELTIESIMKDGVEYATSFMKLFDDKYTPDNFPFRDFFRNLKAWVGANIFAQKDKDGVFVENGYAAEMQEQINADSIAHAAKKLEYIYSVIGNFANESVLSVVNMVTAALISLSLIGAPLVFVWVWLILSKKEKSLEWRC